MLVVVVARGTRTAKDLVFAFARANGNGDGWNVKTDGEEDTTEEREDHGEIADEDGDKGLAHGPEAGLLGASFGILVLCSKR